MTEMDRGAVILPCQRFLSQIEAIVDASGDFIEQMCTYVIYVISI
jgi:hypothetical protein